MKFTQVQPWCKLHQRGKKFHLSGVGGCPPHLQGLVRIRVVPRAPWRLPWLPSHPSLQDDAGKLPLPSLGPWYSSKCPCPLVSESGKRTAWPYSHPAASGEGI
jgi:hypothetical protein